ncbi:hypothetical protein [Flavobacterium sp. W22_SRS_FP1]|uniref:hypothetical protein n=1 Tax=Flavobacterium sp. W22_SRS_FP1 TaxID=3240276 RepID=UPI003F911188
MDLSEIQTKISSEFFKETLLSLITTLEDAFNHLDDENKGILLKWLEFEFLYKQISIYDTMQISWSPMKEQFSKETNQELETISKTKKRNIEYLQRWIIENKSNILKVELPEIDLSGTSATEKIIYLQKLGIIDFLKRKQPFLSSTNSLATVLSAVTGSKASTIQPMINPILSKKVDDRNNPMNSTKTVIKVESQLINIGFNLNETI